MWGALEGHSWKEWKNQDHQCSIGRSPEKRYRSGLSQGIKSHSRDQDQTSWGYHLQFDQG